MIRSGARKDISDNVCVEERYIEIRSQHYPISAKIDKNLFDSIS